LLSKNSLSSEKH